MSKSNFPEVMAGAYRKTTLTTGRTLTASELKFGVITGTTVMTVTLPAASSDYTDYRSIIVNKASLAGNVTVAVTAGFGGNSTSTDNLVLPIGAFGEVYCDGSYWYYCAAPAAS